MTEALNEFPDGLTRQDIISVAETMAKLVIDDETAKNTLKVMARKREAYVDGGIWRLGQRPGTESSGTNDARDLWEPAVT